MADELQLLSLGDASVDVFLNPTESDTLCEIDDKKCLVCFSYGDKIPVEKLNFSVGGNAANNAVGSSRLGVKTAIVLTLGDDDIGNQIMTSLEKERIDLNYIFKQAETNSNYSVIINYGGERTIFTYHAPRSYEFPVQLPVTPWIYLTSMGENFKPFYTHITEFLKKNPQIKMGFNPGSWQLRAGVEELKDVLALTYIIFLNREEAQTMTGLGVDSSEKELLESLTKLGPKIAVITDGPNGAYTFAENKFLKAPVLPVDIVQRTGAGDAFGSGCIAALIKGKTLEEALLWGTVNSASVIGFIGPEKGLLHDSEIPMWLERCKASGIKVEEF